MLEDAGMGDVRTRWVFGGGIALVVGFGILSGLPAAGEKGKKSSKEVEKSWAYCPPIRPKLPAVKNRAWVRNPLDAFILARLEEQGLAPTPEAPPEQLIRRLSFDLTGLPPTPEEVEQFLHDRAPGSYERLVDRLLASSRYGERWAMYWLDLVRYAESDGFKADDIRPAAWRYRDYVIRAFNGDKPYDRFLREQLAGDELYPDDPEALLATAFNRHFPDEYNARNLEQRRQEILNDLTDTTAQVCLGLTFGCARCHDHKFDPIPQKDYYRLQAFFAAFSPRDDLLVAPPEDLASFEKQLHEWEAKTGKVRQQMRDMEEPYRQKIASHNKSKFAKNLQDAYDTPDEKRTPMQKQLAAMLAKQLVVTQQEMTKAMKPEVRKQWQDAAKRLADFDRLKPKAPPTAMGITDVGSVAPATYLLRRGEWRNKGEEVSPGFLSILDDRPVKVPARAPGAKTTGRRAVLAEWLTHPDHPLTARVMVNRLWQHHFGRGIVATPSDFGAQGEPPTHPELLDWLAREFVERGWSLKAMHRLMVTGAAYRQASRHNAAAAKIDPDNRLLWRMNRRRLEGEALRDAMLSVSGLLNLKAGGPSIFPELPAEVSIPRGGWPVTKDLRERNRRSVYIFVKRNLRYPLFAAFDAPDSNETCARRFVSTSAPQALMLLNGKITLDLARAFAGRVLRETAGEPAKVVERTYRLALGRSPDATEAKLALQFLDKQASEVRQRLSAQRPVARPDAPPPGTEGGFGAAVVDLCQVLMNVNEFLYVD
jgi:hypothetical protein